MMIGVLVASTITSVAGAQEREARDAEIIIYGRAIEQIGVATSGSQGTVGYQDFQDKPLSRVGELVENVPGMVATQHSGTGKANQYFLRGFNLDHGTDLAALVEGVPVNMRTHGHGQGYLDLNFMIPELVERIDYRKGPYFADIGDFSAAGTVMFKTADRLSAPIAQATLGSFGYQRLLAAGSVDTGAGDLLLAIDGTVSNGSWVLDEDLEKVNGAIKYSSGTAQNGWSLGLSGYHARWTATDQVRTLTSAISMPRACPANLRPESSDVICIRSSRASCAFPSNIDSRVVLS
jgi:outer membrane receptor protein involved in Fe transport